MWMILAAAWAAPLDTAVGSIAEAGAWHASATGYAGVRSELRKQIEVLETTQIDGLLPLLEHDAASVRFAVVRELERRKVLDEHLTPALVSDRESVRVRMGCLGSASSVAEFVAERPLR